MTLVQAINTQTASTTVEADKNTELISEMIHYAYCEAEQEVPYLVKMGIELNPSS
jgi:hypothetical protein